MIRFHHGINGGPVLDIYSCTGQKQTCREGSSHSREKLLVAKLAPFETSVYVETSDRATIKGYADETLVFTLRYDSERAATAIIFVENAAVQLRVECDAYRDPCASYCSDASSKMPEVGNAQVRKILFNSNPGTSTIPYKVEYQTLTKLGINTVSVDQYTATVDAINQGIYTVFFDGQNTPTSVLYNNPPSYAQVPFDFSRYIGKWYVIASLGIAADIRTYTFYENARGRFMLTDDTEPVSNTDVSVVPNFVGFVRGRDEEEGKMRTLTGLLFGDVQASLEPGNFVFSWIVHDTDYDSYSLNGSPTRQEMVILSRKKKLCNTKQLLCRAKKLGYDVANITTPMNAMNTTR